jgi:PPOX class probable F420-dependent enzyme
VTESDTSWMGKNSTLSKSEVDEFLQRPVVARVGTIQPDGWPYVVPVWQQWDGEAMWIVPREKSAFVRNLSEEPRVSISVALEEAPYTRVQLQGTAEIVEGPVDSQGGAAQWVSIARNMARRYLGQHGPEYLESTMDRPRYLIRIRPVKLRTWEGVEWHKKYTSQ